MVGGRFTLLVDVCHEIVVRVGTEDDLRVVAEEVHLVTERDGDVSWYYRPHSECYSTHKSLQHFVTV